MYTRDIFFEEINMSRECLKRESISDCKANYTSNK